MPHQAALTVRATILPGKVPELTALLNEMGVETNRRQLLPFEQLPVHFARLFVLDDAEDLKGVGIPATLVFLSDIDAPIDSYVIDLGRVAAIGLDQVFSRCEGYPVDPTPETRAAYLMARSVKSSAVYINTVGRALEQVRQEAHLRDAIGAFLDEHARDLEGQSAT